MFDLVVYEEKCVGCMMCIEGCPIPCFDLNEETKKAVVIDIPGCIACRTCEDVCPTSAVKVVLEREKYSPLTIEY